MELHGDMNAELNTCKVLALHTWSGQKELTKWGSLGAPSRLLIAKLSGQQVPRESCSGEMDKWIKLRCGGRSKLTGVKKTIKGQCKGRP